LTGDPKDELLNLLLSMTIKLISQYHKVSIVINIITVEEVSATKAQG